MVSNLLLKTKKAIKSIPWEKSPIFFTRTEDKLVHFKITPDREVNNKTDILARAMHELYTAPRDRIKIQLEIIKKILIRKITFNYRLKDRVFFDIVLSHEGAFFYLTVSERWSKFLELKMKNIWPLCAIERITPKELLDFNIDLCTACDIRLKKANMFSLKASEKNLDPLNSMFAVLKDLDADNKEKVRISFCFDAIDRLDWQISAEEAYKQFRKGKMPHRSQVTREDVIQNGLKAFEYGFTFYIKMKMLIIEAIMGFLGAAYDEEEREKEEAEESSKELAVLRQLAQGGLSGDTMHKIKAPTFNTYIRILSQDTNEHKRDINMRTVANSFKDLNGDNEVGTVELSHRTMQKRIMQILDFKSPVRIDRDICSDEEVAKFIQLPQKTLQAAYRLPAIDIREGEVPDQLREGGIPIGDVELKLKLINTYWPRNEYVKCLPKIVLGPQYCGKTSYAVNYAAAANKLREAVIDIDYIQDCENSRAVEKHIPQKDVVTIDLSDQNKLFALSYPEASSLLNEKSTHWERLQIANLLSGQVEYLINSVGSKITGELSSPMIRYLYAACMVVFIHKDTSIDTVFEVLRQHAERAKFKKIALAEGIIKSNDDIIYDLEQLDEWSRGTKDNPSEIIGTREALIQGVLNRMAELSKNIYVKQMLKAPADKSINFINYIQEGKTVLIRIPQTKFPDPKIRDALATYFMGRIWFTVQLRDQKTAKVVHVILDEAHQIPTCASFLNNHITEFRRHKLAVLFTIHYLKQFKELFDSVKSAGVSYMLIAGVEKENLQLLKEEMQQFTIEDGLSLKPFHSLNIINYGNQYARFISKLPKPVQ